MHAAAKELPWYEFRNLTLRRAKTFFFSDSISIITRRYRRATTWISLILNTNCINSYQHRDPLLSRKCYSEYDSLPLFCNRFSRLPSPILGEIRGTSNNNYNGFPVSLHRLPDEFERQLEANKFIAFSKRRNHTSGTKCKSVIPATASMNSGRDTGKSFRFDSGWSSRRFTFNGIIWNETKMSSSHVQSSKRTHWRE